MDLIAPMLAISSEPFDSPEYSFEIKWDGVRALAAVERNSTWRLWGRDASDYTSRYPELSSLAELPAGTVLDGELVHVVQGRADFPAILRRHQLSSRRKIGLAAERQPIVYVVFDLLQLEGRSLVCQPLARRRQLLELLLAGARPRHLVFSEAVVATGQEFFRQVVDQGHEGVMAKRLDSGYAAGKRAAAWRKVKPHLQLVCVVLGYRGDRRASESLLLAANHAGALRFVGEVRAGMTGNVRSELAPLLAKFRGPKPAVACPETANWLQPKVFCLVRAFGWTGSGLLRYPSLRRLLDRRSEATTFVENQVDTAKCTEPHLGRKPLTCAALPGTTTS